MNLEQRIKKAREQWADLQGGRRPLIFVGSATCGLASGAADLYPVIDAALARIGVEAEVIPTGCIGMCFAEPLVDIQLRGQPRVCYNDMTPEKLEQVLESHLGKGKPLARYAMGTIGDEEISGIPKLFDLPVLKPQVRLVLRNCGYIDPMNVDHYLARDGYQGFLKALTLSPDEVMDVVESSGLRGRGGGGFSTAKKWRSCREAPGEPKYVVCNADEGDPGAFMDRSLLEGDPHAVLEGMCVAAHAIGSTQGYIYVRAEYPLAVERLRRAIADARELGFLGRNIMGLDWSFDIDIFEGAGAFVCGESSALMYSIEGRRGMPRVKPPQSVECGLFSLPTSLNNVETFANVGNILREGAAWFSSYGTEKSKGTKTFALAGKINRPGLIEVPMGITLGEVVEGIGGGIPGGGQFKAAQTGGPSGGCLPAKFLDTPIDFESLAKAGSIMGSGGLVIMDERTCMVDLARYFISFCMEESCGKCVPCRLGTRELLRILERICAGQGEPGDIQLLEDLSNAIRRTALCGLGKAAPNPLLTTLKYFREEYEEHILDKHCRAAVCKGMVVAPCNHTCPAGVEPHRYVRAIAQDDFERAYLIVREKLPLPRVCGLVCPHLCETRCRRGQLDESLSVRALKRAAIENGATAEPGEAALAPRTGKKVAIVGAGPAGLTAAYYLSKVRGHHVEVFDELPDIGGMLRYGITRYHLPEAELEKDLEIIRRAGVVFHTGTRIESVTALQEQGFDAIFLALGAQKAFRLQIAGIDAPGVVDCVEFLRRVNAQGERPVPGNRVVVIGGGNTAVDAARTARRLGAERVEMFCLESREEMPAFWREIAEAEEEGIEIHPSWGPTEITTAKGRATGVKLRRCSSAFDRDGRFDPRYDDRETAEAEADTVIMAVGQFPDIPPGLGVETGRGNRITVDRQSPTTSQQGVFAGGDAVLGPASVIEAVAHGRRAARAIDLYLGGSGEIEEVFVQPEDVSKLPPLVEETEARPRVAMDHRDSALRLLDFDQIELGYSREAAVLEASRCLRCDLED